MAVRNVTASLQLRLKPGATEEVLDAVLGGFIEYAQEVVSFAVKNHPYTDRSGKNSGSIGWVSSKLGTANFGKVSLANGGTSSPIGAASRKNRIEVAVVTTSGYGGHLEVGTVKMNAFPYIVPAVVATKPEFKKALTGVV